MDNRIEHLKGKKVVCIGGGTGSFVTLSGLKKFPLDLSVIVPMSDSGGSNKRIRDEFGLLPTSDVRQCLVALSAESQNNTLLRKLFMYRFDKGEGISGMTFGNLFMAALTDILGSQEEAIRQTGKVLRIRGKVIPASFTDTNLVAEYEDGTKLTEEHFIDEPPAGTVTSKIKKVYLDPPAAPNQQALDALAKADVVVLGPGDLYTSIIPNILVNGMAEALQQSKAKTFFILNLMTKYGQTTDFTATDHVKTLEHYIGKDTIDVVLVNKQMPSDEALAWYEENEEHPVVDDLDGSNGKKIVRDILVKDVIIEKNSADSLKRSIIRHDGDKLARAIVNNI